MITKSSSKFILALLAALLSGAGVLIVNSAFDLPSDSFYYQTNWSSDLALPVINFSHNAYFAWKLDSLILKFLPIPSLIFYIALNFAIFSFGYYLWLAHAQKENFYALAATLLIAPVVLLLFGLDTPIIFALIWFPWLCLVLNLFYQDRKPRLLYTLLILFFALRNAESAFYLSLIPAALALILVKPPKLAPRSLTLTGAALILVPAIYICLTVPLPPFPDYPLLMSSLVPDDGIPGFIRPLFGVELSLPTIDRPFLKHTYILPLCIFAGLFVFLHTRSKSRPQFSLVAVTIALMILLDVFFAEKFAQVAPLAAISRIIPGLFLIPLVPLMFSLLLVFLPFYFSNILPLALSFLVLLILPRNFHEEFNIKKIPELEFPKYRVADAQLVFEDSWKEGKASLKIISPSYRLIRERGPSSLNENWRSLRRKKISAKKWRAGVKASHNNDQAQFMADHDAATRWSTNSGVQTGSEWVLIELPEIHSFDGIYLNLGNYSSDFPRGIKVAIKETCSGTGKPFKDFKTIINYSHWLGPTLHTERGFPYYGPQSWLKILFPGTVDAQCVLISQIDTDNNYDWSITELGFLVQSRQNDQETSL